MKRVSRVQTYDGKIHVDEKAAIKHLDKEFGDVFLPICKKLVYLNKYEEMTDYLSENLELFRVLLKIQDDMKLESCEDEE